LEKKKHQRTERNKVTFKSSVKGFGAEGKRRK